jgi:hypothetical protein
LNGGVMAKRAWCSGCNGYVMLTGEGLCPNGHPKPSLRGIEEVAVEIPHAQPVRRPPGMMAAHGADGPQPRPAFAGGGYGGPNAVGSNIGGYDVGLCAPSGPATPPLDGFVANPWAGDVDPVLQSQLDRHARRVYHDVPFYETWPGIVVILLIFVPLGLFCLWRSAVPTTKQKWAVSGGVAAIIAFNVVRMMLAFSVAMSSMPSIPKP